jgi:nicotinamide mononucleotide adenylyltransferase
MHSESTTDLSIISSNLNSSKSNQENVVLIQTGSVNPIHRSHISNMIKTKQYLENVHNLNVIGGYISPSHDEYVESKLGNQFISSQHRINMCLKAIQEENQQHWLAVDKAESMGIFTFFKFIFISNFSFFSSLFH